MCLVRRGRELIAASIGLGGGAIFLLLGSFSVAGASVSLAWYPSQATNVAGYSVFYGEASRQYTGCLDAGTNTSLSVDGLANGQTYYFATAAYTSSGAVSPYSNEVTNSIPALPTLAALPVNALKPTSPSPVPPPTSSTEKNRSTAKTPLGPPSGVAASLGAGDFARSPGVVSALDEPADVYNGLFYQTDAAGVPVISEATAGFLGNCVVKTNGHFSARLGCGGRFYSLSGTFSASGDDDAVVARRDIGLPNLNIALHLELTLGTGQIIGVVSNMDAANPWVATLAASRATDAFAPEAKYFFISPPPADQFASAQAHWLCELTVASNGVVSLFGWLGDGAPIAQTVAIAADGSFPIYVNLYHQTGLLAGWVNLAKGAPTGSLTWIRPDSSSREQPDQKGFTHVLRFAAKPGSSSTSLQLSR
jgi:hypothetical protein